MNLTLYRSTKSKQGSGSNIGRPGTAPKRPASPGA